MSASPTVIPRPNGANAPPPSNRAPACSSTGVSCPRRAAPPSTTSIRPPAVRWARSPRATAATSIARSPARAPRSAAAAGRSRSRRARKRVLLRFAELMLANKDELALLETLDTGKPIADSLSVDIPSAANCIRWYAEAVDKIYDEVAPTGPRALATITREPMGVVGAIVPWNFPLLMASWKIGPVLASGNSLVLKPSEKSPLTALRVAELAMEAGLPEGVFNVVPGFGQTAGKALASSHGRGLHRVHRLDRHRQDRDGCTPRNRISRRCRSSAAASRRTSCSRIARTWIAPRPRPPSPSSSTRARCVRRVRGCWWTPPSRTPCWRRSRPWAAT